MFFLLNSNMSQNMSFQNGTITAGYGTINTSNVRFYYNNYMCILIGSIPIPARTYSISDVLFTVPISPRNNIRMNMEDYQGNILRIAINSSNGSAVALADTTVSSELNGMVLAVYPR